MSWKDQLFNELAAYAPGGYDSVGPAASEPTALAALALVAARNTGAAARCGRWLCELQGRDGSVGVMPDHPSPKWPTSLAMLAWQKVDHVQFRDSIDRSLRWSLEARGSTTPRNRQFGHDTTLEGWPWAEGTHSWLEPTAFFVLALKSLGHNKNPRTQDGLRLLVDRLLPEGGCNYGNTLVLGQDLLPHLQPTGVALWALAGELLNDDRIDKSLEYLERELNEKTPTTSLCFGLIGLAANGWRALNAENWLEARFRREMHRGTSCYKLALLALAAMKISTSTDNESPLATS